MGFNMPTGGTVRSANLTPNKETGIGNWTKEAFVVRFKAFAPKDSFADSTSMSDTSMAASGSPDEKESQMPVKELQPIAVEQGSFNTFMPWQIYAGMAVEDLSAIFDYLMTLPPLENKVVKYVP